MLICRKNGRVEVNLCQLTPDLLLFLTEAGLFWARPVSEREGKTQWGNLTAGKERRGCYSVALISLSVLLLTMIYTS